MPLWVVNTSHLGQVIVNAFDPEMAVRFATSDGGQAFGAARPATQEDVAVVPLWATASSGDKRPAAVADPNFVASQGFTIPGSAVGGGATKAQEAPPVPPPIAPTPQPGGGQPGAGVGPAGAPSTVGRVGPLPSLVNPGFIPAPGGTVPAPSVFPAQDRQAAINAFAPQFNPTVAQTGTGVEEISPGAGILRGLRARVGVDEPLQTIAGRFLANQPFATALGFGQLTQVPGAPSSLEDFARTAQPLAVRQLAAQAFQRLAGGGAPAGVIQQFAQPKTEDEIEDLVALARAALQSRISPIATSLLRQPSAGQLQSEFIEQSGGSPQANFIDFVRNRLLLNAFGV